ncbi:MAG: cysteine hydrolase [Halioglobus sp.]|nr:cysteine hydrolase [Halioglobus sp.]
MPFDLAPLIAPQETAVLVSECQQAIIGDQSPLNGLAASAAAGNLANNIARLLESARQHQVNVFHCLVARRADNFGEACNTPLTTMMARDQGDGSGMAPGSDGALVITPLQPQADDIVITRMHGITAFHETGLDHFLRTSGIRNIIFTGVSLNIAVFGGTLEAVNRGYRVVIPSDCVAADPPEYGKQLIRYSLRNMAYITSSTEIQSLWRGQEAPATTARN